MVFNYFFMFFHVHYRIVCPNIFSSTIFTLKVGRICTRVRLTGCCQCAPFHFPGKILTAWCDFFVRLPFLLLSKYRCNIHHCMSFLVTITPSARFILTIPKYVFCQKVVGNMGSHMFQLDLCSAIREKALLSCDCRPVFQTFNWLRFQSDQPSIRQEILVQNLIEVLEFINRKEIFPSSRGFTNLIRLYCIFFTDIDSLLSPRR